jgi:hypothetical protein
MVGNLTSCERLRVKCSLHETYCRVYLSAFIVPVQFVLVAIRYARSPQRSVLRFFVSLFMIRYLMRGRERAKYASRIMGAQQRRG